MKWTWNTSTNTYMKSNFSTAVKRQIYTTGSFSYAFIIVIIFLLFIPLNMFCFFIQFFVSSVFLVLLSSYIIANSFFAMLWSFMLLNLVFILFFFVFVWKIFVKWNLAILVVVNCFTGINKSLFETDVVEEEQQILGSN